MARLAPSSRAISQARSTAGRSPEMTICPDVQGSRAHDARLGGPRTPPTFASPVRGSPPWCRTLEPGAVHQLATTMDQSDRVLEFRVRRRRRRPKYSPTL